MALSCSERRVSLLAQLVESVKNILTWIGYIISFPIKILELLYGWDVGDLVAKGMWWLPVAASACIVATLAISLIFRVFSK